MVMVVMGRFVGAQAKRRKMDDDTGDKPNGRSPAMEDAKGGQDVPEAGDACPPCPNPSALPPCAPGTHSPAPVPPRPFPRARPLLVFPSLLACFKVSRCQQLLPGGSVAAPL